MSFNSWLLLQADLSAFFRLSGKKIQSGFTYLTMLFAVAVMSAGLAATGVVWTTASQREKEKELLFVGDQFRQAIALYHLRTPGTIKRYPEKLEDLIKDNRYLSTQRYLRKIYVDPMTGKSEWGLVAAPNGGIMGVYSLSNAQPIKKSGFANADSRFEDGQRYSDWKFIYETPPSIPVAPSQQKAPTLKPVIPPK